MRANQRFLAVTLRVLWLGFYETTEGTEFTEEEPRGSQIEDAGWLLESASQLFAKRLTRNSRDSDDFIPATLAGNNSYP